MSSTELATVKPSFVTTATAKPIIPGDFDSVWRLSMMICASGMQPRDFGTVEKVAVAVMSGLEVGLTPMQALQSIAVVNGKTSLYGDGAIGLVRASGLCEYVKEWTEGEGDQMVAYCEAKRKGGEVRKESFSVADAKTAGLWGKSGPWTQYPRRMLAFRARAWTLRDLFADVLRGLAIAEEMQDAAMRDVTPQPPAPPSPPVPPVPPKTEEKTESAKTEEQSAPASPDKPSSEEATGEERQPPASPSSQEKKPQQTIDADPFDAYAAEFDALMAKAGNMDEAKGVWARRRKNLSNEQNARLVAIRDKHKSRLEPPAVDGETSSDSSTEGSSEEDIQPFVLAEFKDDIIDRLKAAESADDVQDILDEVNGAHDAGMLSEADKEQHFDDAFAEAFERMG